MIRGRVHCQRADYDVYIGRPSRWGNPFSHLYSLSHVHSGVAKIKVSSHREAVEAYRQWLKGEAYQDVEPERRQWILDNLHVLDGKILGCWCKGNQACHGDVLIELIKE